MGATIDVSVISRAIAARKAIDEVISTALDATLDLWAERVLDTYSDDVPYSQFGVLSVNDVLILQSAMPAGTTHEDIKQILHDRLALVWHRRHGSDARITWDIAEWDTKQTGTDRWISVTPRTRPL